MTVGIPAQVKCHAGKGCNRAAHAGQGHVNTHVGRQLFLGCKVIVAELPCQGAPGIDQAGQKAAHG